MVKKCNEVLQGMRDRFSQIAGKDGNYSEDKDTKKWNFLSCKADNCVSVLKYSVRDHKDNISFESSKLFGKFFRIFS